MLCSSLQSIDLKTLLHMCIDISNGMTYLAEMQFVHRDLAARNCMYASCYIDNLYHLVKYQFYRVDETLSVKVADFGLSRDIYNQGYYRLERKTRLPVKWLPPESLYDNIYNEKSDVVSSRPVNLVHHCVITLIYPVVIWSCVLGDL